MTPEQAIAALDRQIAAHGQTVNFYRYSGNPRVKSPEVTVKAFARPVKNEDLVGDIKQDSSTVAVSPTGLGSMSDLKKGDKAWINGKERSIEIAKPIFLNDVLVRINLIVLG